LKVAELIRCYENAYWGDRGDARRLAAFARPCEIFPADLTGSHLEQIR